MSVTGQDPKFPWSFWEEAGKTPWELGRQTSLPDEDTRQQSDATNSDESDTPDEAKSMIERVQRAAKRAEAREQEATELASYAAVDWDGTYGVIDTGVSERGVRELIAHSRNGIFSFRPGDVVRLISVGPRRRSGLRVMFTTPARYYAPGRRVTSIRMGVNDREWGELVRPRTGKPTPSKKRKSVRQRHLPGIKDTR